MRKRFFAWLVILAMALSLLPVSALAAEESGSGSVDTTSNSEPTWQPDGDGAYVVSSDDDLTNMVETINQAGNGSNLKFRFVSKGTSNGTVYQFTSGTAITVPKGVTVTIDLGLCDMLFNSGDSAIITNNGTLSIHGTTCTSSQYGRIGSEGQTIVNNGTMSLDTVYLAGTLDNQSQLTLSQTAASTPGSTNTCTVGALSNTGTVEANSCVFAKEIGGSGGTMVLTNCHDRASATVALTGSAQLEITGGYYFTESVSLTDNSSIVIENSQFSNLKNEGLNVADTATLQINGAGGVFAFNPQPYLTGEGLLVLRSSSAFEGANAYTVTAIVLGASAPELTVEQGNWKDSSGNVAVTISTTTTGAQVFYSTNSAQEPIDCQTDIKTYRTAYVPVGATVYAVALKEGCPAVKKALTVTEPVTPGWAAPEISPSDNQAYQNSVTVTITAKEPDAVIYYTTNGQTPGYSTAAQPGTGAGTTVGGSSADLPIVGTRYSGPFTLTSSTTVMAVAIVNGDQSEVASRQYRVVTNTNPGGGSTSGSHNDDEDDDRDTSTETTRNPDGSTTTTVTDNRTGTVTETTRAEDGTRTVVETLRNGDTTTTVTRRDGTVATTTVVADEPIRADVDFSSQAVADSEAGRLTAPVQVDTRNAVVVFSGIRQPVEVAVPVDGLTAGTVAVIGGEIIKTAIPENGSLVIPMAQAGTVTIMDNTRDFTDVPTGYWAAESITFATSRELFHGTSAETFTPDSAMTRQMLVTVLARLDGAEIDASPYELGMAWAQESGISDGSNPAGNITREQLAVMLYRYAGSPAVDGSLTRFADTDAVSSYARETMTWAVANGIVTGTGGGNLTPQGLATRAQVATMLQRYLSA